MNDNTTDADRSVAVVICRPRCFECGGPLPDGVYEGWCSDVCRRTYPILRWTCPCGRFIAESSIRETDHRDDSTYYGIRTDTTYTCSRCGEVEREPWLVEVGRAVAPA